MSDRCTLILASHGGELSAAYAKDAYDALAARFPGELDVHAMVRDDPVASVRKGEADVAVFRMEHLPAKGSDDLALAAVLPRKAFTDALVAEGGLRDLPRGGRVATSSLRRRAMVLRARTDLKVDETHAEARDRVQLWKAGGADAVVLPTASLQRLAIDAPFEELDPDVFVPTPGQGAVGCVCAPGSRFEEFLEGIDDVRTRMEVDVERAVLRVLGGNASLPLGIRAAKRGPYVLLTAIVLSLDGRRAVSLKETIASADALYHADEFGERIKGMGADVLIERARSVLD